VAANEPPPPAAPVMPPKPLRRRLGEILVDARVVDDIAIQRALGVQKMGGGRLGAILIKLRLCTEAQIREALKQQMGIEIVRLDTFDRDEAAISALPRELMLKYEAIPLRQDQDTIHVAMLDPFNLTAIDDMQFATGKRIVVVSCTESDFTKFVDEHLKSQSLMKEILEGGEFYQKAIENVEGTARREKDKEDGAEDVVHDLKIAGEQAPIITLCNFLLVESITRRASDIHIEPYETYLRIRLRIDGVLHTLLTPPRRLHGAMITRMKIMADMDISKRREPQDGHIAIRFEGETCHYRVSTLPTVYGEKCVIRLLKKDASLTSLDDIGFDPEDLERFKKSIALPQGIVLVTGPTGSGKTTTLHAGISYINQPGVNIVTLEDPVEATIQGINHVQINAAAGVTFASGLRSILRQDPDVVFVGEMRDTEVSAIAVKAALTGHLVMSTLHTNSAAESLMRLTDMGVASYLMANALVMIVAQRLVRRVCPGCAEHYTPTSAEREEFQLDDELLAKSKLRKGRGCTQCFESGYRGRAAVYEVLCISNELRSLIRRNASVEEIIAQARLGGMKLLFQAGVEKALAGVTTLAEVRRTLSEAQ
jgi:type IV pilus assembly protein PilB